MMKKLIFITGGARSGKSRFALNYANRNFSEKLYLATSEILDQEMAKRVENHKKMRGPEWKTLEEPLHIADQINKYGDKVEVILLDCITLWLSNLLTRGIGEEDIINEIDRLINSLRGNQTSFIIVSNEVGMGIVPAEPIGRRFRDLQGMTNQKIAQIADIVILMVSGIPIFLKGQL